MEGLCVVVKTPGSVTAFVESTNSKIVDKVREEAARVCEETAKVIRGERGPLRTPDVYKLTAEFSDAAFGVASEVTLAIAEAVIGAGCRMELDQYWTVGASLLRAGWKRGQRIEGFAVGKGAPS